MAELKLIIKSSLKCLLTSLLNSGFSTKKGIGVPYTSSELNVSPETSLLSSLTLHVASVVRLLFDHAYFRKYMVLAFVGTIVIIMQNYTPNLGKG